MKSYRVVCVFILCTVVPIARAIQCYSCSSGTDVGCESSNRTRLARFKVDCEPASGTAVVNYKTLNRCAKTLKDGELTRACYWLDPNIGDNTCRSAQGMTGCLCMGDFCNATIRRYASNAVMLISVFVSLVGLTNFGTVATR